MAKRKTTGRPWSKGEDQALTSAVLQAESQAPEPDALPLLLRDRSWRGIQEHAQQRGLLAPGKVPVGFVTIATAARKLGYRHQTMARILAWARVKTFVRRGRSGEARPQPHRLVEWSLALGAHERWARAETVSEAAARHGMSRSVLLKLLRRLGGLGKKRKGQRHHLDPTKVDRAVAAWKRNS